MVNLWHSFLAMADTPMFAQRWRALDREAQLLACAEMQAKHPDLALDIEATVKTGWAHWLPPVREGE